MSAAPAHIPVMAAEAVAALAIRPGETHIDATFGGGGYARAMAAAGARVIAIDRDPDAIARGAALGVAVRAGRFGDLDALIDPAADGPIAGVVFDFGVSSFQLDSPERGFSFRFDAPLDMRMEKAGPSAAEAVNALSEAALADVIYLYGEETASRRIARTICAARPVAGTAQLAELVAAAVGGRKGARIHPATRTFQALRILVNDELGEIARGLSAAERILAPGGRLAAVSFHSLEDRLVKTFLTERSGGGGQGSRHRPSVGAGPEPSFRRLRQSSAGPAAAESADNPRARSARLRFAERTDAPAWGAFAATPFAARAAQEWERLGC